MGTMKPAGRVWAFGDNISTEYMMPGHVMLSKMSEEEAKRHCMRAIRPEFSENVVRGDIVVAGENFGCGSSRLGSRLLQAVGVSCVVVESCAGIFMRNAISGGLPVIEVTDARERFRNGELCSIDLQAGAIANQSTGAKFTFPAFPEDVLRILEVGGIVPLLKSELRRR